MRRSCGSNTATSRVNNNRKSPRRRKATVGENRGLTNLPGRRYLFHYCADVWSVHACVRACVSACVSASICAASTSSFLLPSAGCCDRGARRTRTRRCNKWGLIRSRWLAPLLVLKKWPKKNVETISIYSVASTLGRILQVAAAY